MVRNIIIHYSVMQELQSTRGADPQPEYYIDQIAQMTNVSLKPKLGGWDKIAHTLAQNVLNSDTQMGLPYWNRLEQPPPKIAQEKQQQIADSADPLLERDN